MAVPYKPALAVSATTSIPFSLELKPQRTLLEVHPWRRPTSELWVNLWVQRIQLSGSLPRPVVELDPVKNQGAARSEKRSRGLQVKRRRPTAYSSPLKTVYTPGLGRSFPTTSRASPFLLKCNNAYSLALAEATPPLNKRRFVLV